MGKIKLMDCTLGRGGKMSKEALGEEILYQMRLLLQKSGIDIIELGTLCSHTKGPHYGIYTTPELPPTMVRRPGQDYAMLLGENRPELSEIPARSVHTVDILRILLTPKRLEEELEYCVGLREKGYHVAVIAEETARYSENELAGLLKKVSSAQPWACYIYDKSGIMNCAELAEAFDCFDRILPPDVQIGFHASDNQKIISNLVQAFLSFEADRGLLLDSAAGGFSCEALQIKSEEIALQMNQAYGTNYAVPVLEYCRELLMPHLTPKEDGNLCFCYRAAAEQRCAFRYAEYYCELDISPVDQMDIFAEIPQADKLTFSRRAANQALVRCRKKRLNMVLIVPTANRANRVDSFLFTASRDLLRFGIDIVIYDSSDNERTQAVTANFQLEDFVNIYYKRYTGDFDGNSLDEKVITAFQEHLDYDYIWVCRDETIPTVASFYYELLSAADSGAEWIIVDASFKNQGRRCFKKYENCVDVCRENLMRMNTLGLCIFKNTAIEQILLHQPLNDNNYCFYIPFAPFHEIAQRPVNIVLILSDVHCYSVVSHESFCTKDVISLWGERWHDLVLSLPAVYESIKPSLMKIGTYDLHPFHIKPLLYLRTNNRFNIGIYKRHKDLLAKVSDTPRWKFYFAALAPKPLCRLLLKLESRALAKPEARLSKLHRRLFDIYVRLGR